jgi:hypothetical protein
MPQAGISPACPAGVWLFDLLSKRPETLPAIISIKHFASG